MSNKVMVRDVQLGAGAPVVIQSMCNVDSRDYDNLIKQVNKLEEVGCQIVRIAVPDKESLEVFSRIRKNTDMPLVADIHFDYKMAIGAVEAGADKIRINPGNIGSNDRIKAVVDACKARNIPIRVGVNSGSVEKEILAKYGHVCPEALAESALKNLAIIENMGYDNLVVSMKASDVKMNYEAHRIAASKTNHPFHIGITEAGTMRRGKVKSAAGIGALLLAGIGDTLRVSLTADPVEEIIFAKELLECIGMRKPRVEVVSCPTCGRTRINLQALAEKVESRLLTDPDISEGIKVAVMGCVVNGPGEAKEADFGVCGGDGKGVVIAKGEIVATVKEDELCDKLMEVIKQGR